MKDSKHIGKLFSALVLGGAIMAHADDTTLGELIQEAEQQPEICQVKVVATDYSLGQKDVRETSVCVDEMTDEEVLQVIKEAKSESCLTPFCGCWLG